MPSPRNSSFLYPLPSFVVQRLALVAEEAGHQFHGNQWTIGNEWIAKQVEKISKFTPTEERIKLETLYDMQDDPGTKLIMERANEHCRDVDVLMKQSGLDYNRHDVMRRAITDDAIWEGEGVDGKSVWPTPVYVSANKDPNTVGLLLHKDGKMEMFEGNDEATPETLDKVNDALGVGDKTVTVYGNHTHDIAERLRNGELVPGVFVSPNKQHAEGYWGDGREMVRLKVPLKRIHQHSDVDWQIRPENEPTKASGSTQGHPFFGNQYTNKEGQSGSDLWDSKGARQEFGSAETSINEKKMPSSISRIDWKSGTINADIGGGRFDNVTQHLATKGVTNHIYDPFNRSPEHNSDVAEKIKDGQAHTVTVNNVLNVIKEPEARDRVIRQAVKDDGKSYFQIYEGAHADGVGRETTKGWQENRKTGSYVPEIAKHFGKVSKSGNLIIAEKPLRQSKLSGRNLWGREGLQW